MQMIKLLNPDQVILHANWNSRTNIGYDIEKLQLTVQKINAISTVRKVVLLGPAPQYLEDLPKALWKCYGASAIPQYSKCGLDTSIADLDKKLSKVAGELNIQYISLFGKMCNEQGCLVRVGDEITTTDYGHLTPHAARFVVNNIAGDLLSDRTISTQK
jgi:hypothetical protein